MALCCSLQCTAAGCGLKVFKNRKLLRTTTTTTTNNNNKIFKKPKRYTTK